MMEMFRKAALFYKLAAEEKKDNIWTKEDYDTFVKEINNHYVSQMLDVMKEYHNKEYFQLEDFLEPIWDQQSFFNIGSFIQETKKHKLPEDIIKQIVQYLVERELLVPINIKDYLLIEQLTDFISPETLAKAQKKMILALIKDFKWDEKMMAENPMSHRVGPDLWKELYTQSTKFPKEWLEELAKRFGVEFYGEAVGKMRRPDALDTNKDVMTEYDVAELFNKYKNINIGWFKIIIEKANDNAREYIRRFLYSPTGYGKQFYTFNDLFMLDNEMKPMNANYEGVDWPADSISIERLSNISDEGIKNKWNEVFSDFKVMPL